MDVEQHGPRGVGVVGDVHLAAGEFPDQPGIDGAEHQLAFAGALAAAFNVVQDPLDLGTGEVRVNHQTCGVLDVLLKTVALELLADLGAAAALPDDGVVDRAAGVAFPDYRGFTLVGDADGCNLVVVQIGLRQCLGHARRLSGEDFHRVVFDPACLRVMLDEFALGSAHHVGVAVEDDGARAGGALVKSNDVVLVLCVSHVDCLALLGGIQLCEIHIE